MRQRLELHAGRRRAGVSVVGDQVPATDLDRVHADLFRGKIDQPLGDRAGDGMADGAILAGDVLVLEHDAGARPIVRRVVGAADQVDDLVGLDGAGARIHRIRPDASEIVDLETGDGAVLVDADAALADVVAGVDVGVEALDPVGDELDRAPQQLGQRIGRHLVGVDVHLDTERAADVLAYHPHLRLFEAEMFCRDILHHMRRLGALIDRQALIARIPVGQHRARLQRHAGVAAENELGLNHFVGPGKGFVDLAGIEIALEGEIVAEVGMNDRRLGSQRRAHVCDRRQFIVVDHHLLGSVFGERAAARDDGSDGLALPADAVDGDGVLRRRLQALQMSEHADPRRDNIREFGSGDHGDHAAHRLGGGGIDADDPGMGIGRAQEHDMRHPRQAHVADILPPALHQAVEIRPRHGLADVGVRPV